MYLMTIMFVVDVISIRGQLFVLMAIEAEMITLNAYFYRTAVIQNN